MKRLPTKAEFEALLKLPHKWDKERKGGIFTADNGNELFFPPLGYRFDIDVYSISYCGYYWSTTPDGGFSAWYLYFDSDEANMDIYYCNYGRTIRLISDEPCDGYINMGTGIYWAIENYQEGDKIYFTWNEAMAIQDKVNGNVPEEHLLTIPDSIPIDWEQRRYEIAKAALAGLCANAQPINRGFTSTAQLAVAYADALIAELQKGGNNENN